MNATKRVGQIQTIAGVVGRHPSQARYVPRLLRTQGKGTMGVRLPWLPFTLLDFLDDYVTSSSRIFEYGGGGSTAWFTAHAGHVTTVEHDEKWFQELSAALQSPKLDLRYAVADGPDSAYVRAIDDQGDASIDVVVVDGRERVACLKRATSKVRPGGLLILDDSDREKYASAEQVMRNWDRRVFEGLVPCKDIPGRSTVWRRPA